MASAVERLFLSAPERTLRRAALFRESPLATVERWATALIWNLMPKRIAGMPNMLSLCLREILAPDYALPDPEQALDNPPGLAGIAHEFSAATILAAYRRGLYPLAHAGPMKWWSPPQRSILLFHERHIARRLRRRARLNLTWITPRVMHAYAALFDAGHAHSFEVWNERGALVGGGYGLAVGGAFATESQFSREPNASKIGFTVLNFHLARWGFAFNDGKVMTPTCRDMGFRDIPRREFLARLAEAVRLSGRKGPWQVEADTRAVADW